ncbi:MAG: NUDIX domain-containing protein [Nanoarchaeota archaeon]|nr:NUDIX domain-containing protein [Nanoarchaeota archaeon]
MKVIIVDKEDNVIGSKERELVKQEDIYRVSSLWIMNSKNEFLLARRALSKTNDPGKWGPAVAGTIEEGETYGSNIIKEAEEELGLTDIKLTKGPKRFHKGKHNFFYQWFFLRIDKMIEEFSIQKDEVEEIKWISKTDLLKAIRKRPDEFLDGVAYCAQNFYF